MPEQSAAFVLRHRHAAEMRAVDVGNAVVPGQPLVDERVVGGQQLEHRPILAHDAVEEHLGLAPERLPQVVVEVRELVDERRHVAQVAEVQPLRRRSWSTSASRAWIGQHAPHLLLEHRRLTQAALARAIASSSSSGMLLQRKNDSRDASSTSLIAVHVPARRRRIALDPEDELGAGQHDA